MQFGHSCPNLTSGSLFDFVFFSVFSWGLMNERRKFLKELRLYAQLQGLPFRVDKKKGKGSHYRVRLGNRVSTVPKRLTPTLKQVIRKQLGIACPGDGREG